MTTHVLNLEKLAETLEKNPGGVSQGVLMAALFHVFAHMAPEFLALVDAHITDPNVKKDAEKLAAHMSALMSDPAFSRKLVEDTGKGNEFIILSEEWKNMPSLGFVIERDKKKAVEKATKKVANKYKNKVNLAVMAEKKAKKDKIIEKVLLLKDFIGLATPAAISSKTGISVPVLQSIVKASSAEDAYVIFMSHLFSEAAGALKNGASIEDAQKASGLSKACLAKIKGNPGAALAGDLLAECMDLAWESDD
jgi:hypothetical protein